VEVPSRGARWALRVSWLADSPILCASICMFWDAYAGVAGVSQGLCSVDGLRVTMYWQGSVSRVVGFAGPRSSVVKRNDIAATKAVKNKDCEVVVFWLTATDVAVPYVSFDLFVTLSCMDSTTLQFELCSGISSNENKRPRKVTPTPYKCAVNPPPISRIETYRHKNENTMPSRHRPSQVKYSKPAS
jgi:hypothetical protein